LNSKLNQPAITGGTPVVSTGLPVWPISDESILNAFQDLHSSGAWGRYHAEHSRELIQTLSKYYHSEHVLLTASGTSAVELALRGLSVSQGDEVILAAYDFKANFTNVCLLGALPVLIDIRSDNGQMDIEQVHAAVSSKTKAIIASHLHGGLVEMESLRQIANDHKIGLIEDCCQVSPLATLNGKTTGSFGDVTALSFGGSKLLSAGRGGAVISHQDQIAQRIKLYQDRGNSAYPMSEMQAAVLLPQLDVLPQRHSSRLQFVETLKQLLNEEHGLRLIEFAQNTQPDFYKLGLWYDASIFADLSRENFCTAMRAEGIPLDPGFAGLHRIHAKRRFLQCGQLSIADRAHDSLTILHHPFLLGGEFAANQFVAALDKLRDHATILKRHFE
jgi:perosamine synthetase